MLPVMLQCADMMERYLITETYSASKVDSSKNAVKIVIEGNYIEKFTVICSYIQYK